MKRNKKKRNNIKYSKIMIFLSLLLFGIMIFRVVILATAKEVDGTNLQKLASKRTTRKDVIKATRGTIYSSDKEPLAINVASYKIIAYLSPKRTDNKKHPQHVVDKEKTAKLLAPILGMEEDDILKRLSKKLYQVEFGSKGKGLSELTKKKIEELNLPGIDFIESYKRYYPKGQFLSYTLGYAKNSDADDENSGINGEMGIEKYYNKILKGKDGSVTYQKDLRGYKIADTKEVREDAIEGKDIYLTIDSNIQFFIEQSLAKAKEEIGYEWFTIVVADAKTGAILGIGNNPSFDPNKRDISSYIDNFITPYEPGSTMKTFTYMAAMENGVYDGNESYESGVYTTSDGTQIGDWNRNGWGTISFDKGYALSSNVGVINIINRHMNAAMLRQYFKKLGFGKKTGVPIPNESVGYLNFKYETEIFNAGFGQGITTTPAQNIKALTPLTNDGMLLNPYLIEKIVDKTTGEVVYQGKRKEVERVASTETVNKMISLMDATVNEVGNTGSGYRIDSHELIGKTGTAQIASERGGGYLNGQNDIISSFAGIYPKSDPKIIIYASVKRPSMGLQKPISNAVKEIVDNVGKYLGTELSATSDNVIEYKLPSFVNKNIDSVKTTLSNNGMNYKVLGEGNKVIKQFPSKKEKVTNKDTIFLITNDQPFKIPNLVGLSSKDATAILKLLGVKVKLDGSGYVTAQSIAEATPITEGMEITLALSPKFSE